MCMPEQQVHASCPPPCARQERPLHVCPASGTPEQIRGRVGSHQRGPGMQNKRCFLLETSCSPAAQLWFGGRGPAVTRHPSLAWSTVYFANTGLLQMGRPTSRAHTFCFIAVRFSLELRPLLHCVQACELITKLACLIQTYLTDIKRTCLPQHLS